MPARFEIDGRPFCTLINRSRYHSDDLVELLTRSINLGLERRWDRLKHCLNDDDLWRYILIVVEDYGGVLTVDTGLYNVRDKAVDVSEIMDSRRGGRGLRFRITRHERDRYHQNIVDRIGTIESPAASEVFRGAIADKFNFVVAGIHRPREEGDQISTGLRVRVTAEPAMDDLGDLNNAYALRYRASFENSWSPRLTSAAATMLNQIRLAEKRCVARGGEPGSVEAQVRRDPRLAFWLDVVQRWESFEKAHPDAGKPRYRVEEKKPDRDTRGTRVTVERV